MQTTVTDGNGHAVNRLSDVFGRLVLVRELTGSSQPYTNYADTRYSYDALGNLTAVGTSAPNNAQPAEGDFLRRTAMTYDGLGRKLTMADPDMGDWEYEYSTNDRLTRQKHLSGTTVDQATCFYYDNLGRLLRRVNDDSPATICPSYAATSASGANHLASYSYDTRPMGIGQPAIVNWGPNPSSNSDTFDYDGEGRLSKQTRRVNGQTFVYEIVQYDLLDRPTQVKLPGGEVVVTTYDKEGANTLTAGGTQLIDNVGYNERGQLVFLGRPGTAPDTTLSYYGAGDNFRLSAITTSGSSNFPDFTYTGYDAVGNLTNFTAGSHSYIYTYDELNRLKTVTGANARSYNYDRLGNFAAVTRDGDQWVYGYAASNQSRLMSVSNLPLTVAATNGYDSRGNLQNYDLDGESYQLIFDAENRLEKVTKENDANDLIAEFYYDADGNRILTVHKSGSTETSRVYTPFPDYELTDPATGANVTRTTYRLAGQIVAVRRVEGANNAVYYSLTNHLGSVAALSELDGDFVTDSRAEYDPFGALTTTLATNPSITNHGFTGHRHNNTGTNDIGLIYMNARYYLPEVGRFISADTIVPEPQNPQSYNRYSYVRNSPMNYSDPTGHRECGATDLDCGGGGGSTMIPPAPRPSDFVDPIEDFYNSGHQFLPDDSDNPHFGVDLVSRTTNDVVALSTGRVRVADACTNDPCEGDTSTAANFGTGSVLIVEYAYDMIPASIRMEIGLSSDMSIYVQYQHLAEISTTVSVGEEVLAGTIIGSYGNTGHSFGDHLHLEIHMGPSHTLGVGYDDGTYDTHSNTWHEMALIDPNLFWDIPTLPPER